MEITNNQQIDRSEVYTYEEVYKLLNLEPIIIYFYGEKTVKENNIRDLMLAFLARVEVFTPKEAIKYTNEGWFAVNEKLKPYFTSIGVQGLKKLLEEKGLIKC